MGRYHSHGKILEIWILSLLFGPDYIGNLHWVLFDKFFVH